MTLSEKEMREIENAGRRIVRETPCNNINYKADGYAYFKRIDGTAYGVKFFLDLPMRDKTFELQEYASRFDLAPKVFGKFSAKTPDGCKVYGYITEAIEKTEKARYLGSETAIGSWDKLQRWKWNCDDLGLLKYQLEKNGISTKDLHWNNVGYLNGKLVCIDFSEERFTD